MVFPFINHFLIASIYIHGLKRPEMHFGVRGGQPIPLFSLYILERWVGQTMLETFSSLSPNLQIIYHIFIYTDYIMLCYLVIMSWPDLVCWKFYSKLSQAKWMLQICEHVFSVSPWSLWCNEGPPHPRPGQLPSGVWRVQTSLVHSHWLRSWCCYASSLMP